jgi:hypothetical protein
MLIAHGYALRAPNSVDARALRARLAGFLIIVDEHSARGGTALDDPTLDPWALFADTHAITPDFNADLRLRRYRRDGRCSRQNNGCNASVEQMFHRETPASDPTVKRSR